MQQLNYFDIIVLGLTFLLGLKGLIRGFIKEIFALIGIIGGVFMASRLSNDVGDLLAKALNIQNEKTIILVGFIVTLIVVWGIAYILGIIFSKMSSASGLGIFDRFLGFVFGSGKVFLLFAIITYAVSNIKAIEKNLNSWTKDSIVYPILVDAGRYIIKIDTTKLQSNISKAIDKTIQKSKEVTNQIKDDIIEEKVRELKNE